MKMDLKTLSLKCRPYCLDLNVLKARRLLGTNSLSESMDIYPQLDHCDVAVEYE